MAAPVLFFDELDFAPARGRGSDGGGVMDRGIAALTEIDAGFGCGTAKGSGDDDDDDDDDDDESDESDDGDDETEKVKTLCDRQ